MFDWLTNLLAPQSASAAGPKPAPRPAPMPLGGGEQGYPTTTSGRYIPSNAPIGAESWNTAPLDLGAALASGGLNTRTGGETTGVTGPGGQDSGGTDFGAPPAPAGGTGRQLPDRSASIAIQQAGLASLDDKQKQGLSSVDQRRTNILGGYDTERSRNEGLYNTQTTSNKANLQRQSQAALSNAAQGRRGLLGTLSSLGALSGSGIELANHAVQRGANIDLSGADDSYRENQTLLNQNIEDWRLNDEERRRRAEQAAEDARSRVRYDVANERQGFLQKLHDDYMAMENTSKAREYANQLAALFPQIANYAVPSTSLAAESLAFTPATLSNYIGGNTSTQVKATPATGNELPGLVAYNPQRRRRED